jgi:DNA primase
LLSRYARQAVICYDPDSAGQNAVDRSIPLLLEAGIDVRIAALPQGMDPDLTIRREGLEAFSNIITSAMTFIEFKVMRARLQTDLSQISEKSVLVNNLLNLLTMVSDPVKKRLYLKELAEAVGLDESFVLDLTRKKDGLKPSGNGSASQPEYTPDWEGQVLSILLRRPEKIESTLSELASKGLASEKLIGLLKKLGGIYQDVGRLDGAGLVMKFENQDEQNMLLEALARKDIPDDSLDGAENDEQQLSDYIAKLEQQNLKPRLRALQSEIRQAEKNGDSILVTKLLSQYQKLKSIKPEQIS